MKQTQNTNGLMLAATSIFATGGAMGCEYSAIAAVGMAGALVVSQARRMLGVQNETPVVEAATEYDIPPAD